MTAPLGKIRKIPVFPPKMVAEKTQKPAVGDQPAVTFDAGAGAAHSAVPNRREQRAVAPSTQPVSALAAHSRGRRGLANAAGPGERVEKGELAFDRPSVAADAWLRGGAALVHRPAWITKAVL